MEARKRMLKLSRTQWISVAVLASSIGLAAAVTIPNVFTAGTTISASQVNANFAALNNGLPIVWAATDTTSGGTTVTTRTVINSVAINAPADGNLVVSGMVFVNNQDAATQLYSVNLLVDGSQYPSGRWQALGTLTSAELNTFSYTVTLPITAGAHTIAQDLGGFIGTPSSFFYNSNNLTVTFLPTSQVTFTPAFAPAQAPLQRPGLNEAGF